ncbi:BQ5605_C004g03018 [Microbotryum silenes-dioicae]|uniref:BQ5605_C004g03018 protein n=1 Tax=Microbotryum silenes-dioicae TaxID=796604 RepID=A0A2X0ME12_9BASI|nr:BQ5605_C004g03018 [Microbotryum silenes-dioicae]
MVRAPLALLLLAVSIQATPLASLAAAQATALEQPSLPASAAAAAAGLPLVDLATPPAQTTNETSTNETPGTTIQIPLRKRGSAELTKEDGSISWDRVQPCPKRVGTEGFSSEKPSSGPMEPFERAES